MKWIPKQPYSNIRVGSRYLFLWTPFLLVILSCRSTISPRPSDDAIRHNNLGVALMDAGPKDPKYFPEALKEFEAALASSPNYLTARINLGMGYYYAGQGENALNTLTQVLKESPDNLHANYVLGLLREMNGAFPEARVHFEKVCQLDPEDPNGWFHLGYCYSKNRQYAEAIEPFRQAAKLLPYQRRVRYSLYMALSRGGKAEEAQTELENFKKLESSSVRVVEAPKSSMEYLKQGKYAEAIAESIVPATARSEPSPLLRDVTASLGIVPKSPIVPISEEISKILHGEPTTRGWFTNPSHLMQLVAATGAGASFCDFNNDGRLDLFWVTGNGVARLFEQTEDGHFVDVTEKTGLAGKPLQGTACAWGDYDNDGWSDLLVVGYGQIHLFANKHGRFQDVTRSSGIASPVGPHTWATGAAFADVDHDGDLDIAVTCLADLSQLPAKSEIRFPDDFPAQTNLLFQNNGNGVFKEIGGQASIAAGNLRSRSVWFSDVNEDRAIDFVVYDFSGKPILFLNQKDGKFALSQSTPAKLPKASPWGESRAHGDFNGDGAVDELIVHASNAVVLNQNETRPANWLKVRLEGYAVPGKVKSNRLGIGAKVEVRSVGQWERKELHAGNPSGGCDAPEIMFDLGDQKRIDFVRAVFPSGVRWTLKDVPANEIITLQEPLLDVNSCPALFTWNGHYFEFITDTLGAGILGELVAPRHFWQPDPDEWVRIAGQQLQPQTDGSLEVRFTNPLEEVTYFDHVALLAIDHPGDVEVYSNERMVNEPKNREPVQFFALGNRRAIRKAVDQHGHDVTDLLLETDRHYVDHFSGLPFKGFAEPWSITLDLGDISKFQSPVLLLYGWSYWNSSASIVAAAQAQQELWGPVLEVQDLRGQWRLATEDLGVAAGLPRPMAVDLSEILSRGEHRIRIRTNRTLYYDQISITDAVQTVPLNAATTSSPLMQFYRVPLRSANLHWLGYPRRLLPDGKMPELPDYSHLDNNGDWGTHSGQLTRFGDVTPLLVRSDDQYVIMEHGEEVSLRFSSSQEPPLRQGWRRTYFLYTDGYEKGYELHSAQAESVEALPFHGMSSYPYSGEQYPSDADHIRYLLEWNTRPSFMRK
ncbi:MAG: FG-GAP-like repeat-containing protein [Terriglobia bacterium]